MQFMFVAGVIAAGTLPQGIGGAKIIKVPQALQNGPVVEATTDKGDTVELVVRCPKGTAVISYSKSERLFCSARHACMPSLADIAAKSCD